jgi:putative oxidoreductase
MKFLYSDSTNPIALSVLRIIVGFLMVPHGIQKLFGGLASPRPVAELFSLSWYGGVIELFIGGLFMIGLFTRPAAFILSGTMAVAYWIFHGLQMENNAIIGFGVFWPIINRGELAALYCFVFLYFVFAGGGSWSLDRLIFGKKKAA